MSFTEFRGVGGFKSMEKTQSEIVEKELWERPITEALDQCINKIQIRFNYYNWLYSNKELMYDLGSKSGDSYNKSTYDNFFKTLNLIIES
ncbi:hypothetical protein CN424_23325 [Bacillus cereus]|nr:hypothetical protein CN424_23325 [Bacillus cereus]